jgi:hypothetical protein
MENRTMSTEFRPDFARRVVQQARLIQRRRRDRRRAALGVGVLMALLVGGVFLFSGARAHPSRASTSLPLLDSDEASPLSADAVLSTLEYFSERGDDPAVYFFPDSEALTASAPD